MLELLFVSRMVGMPAKKSANHAFIYKLKEFNMSEDTFRKTEPDNSYHKPNGKFVESSVKPPKPPKDKE